MRQNYYQRPAERVMEELETWAVKGLTRTEAAKRLERYGRNELQQARRISPLKLFLSQFKDALIIVLIVAAAISLTLSRFEEHGSPTEGLLILFIVLAIALVGFLNEYKAEKTVEALKKLVGQSAKVRRGGEVVEITAAELVPGDIILLEEGMKVPADIRLVEVRHLQANEASLTGESMPVTKQSEAVEKESVLGDQRNMVFSGTIVTTGTAEGVVVATGQESEIGQIAGLVSAVEDEATPMQKKLDALGKQLGFGVLAICAFVFVVILIFDHELLDKSMVQRLLLAFTAAVALAVAAIPEGLAFVVRISLALGARRMAAKNALVRRLSAVEALGSTDVVCSDKTGTLTKGEMTVREIWTLDGLVSVGGSGYETSGELSAGGKTADARSLASLLEIGALCNNAHLKAESILGDPTEAALLVSAAKAGIEYLKLQQRYARVDELPFSSERKMMSTVHHDSDKFRVAAKGAVEMILSHCTHVMSGGKAVKLTAAHKHQILEQNERMAGGALRVLAFAGKTESRKPTEKQIETGLAFYGLQAMMDPPRAEVIEVVQRVTSEAGMRVIMITGDYIETAKAVAREIGIEGEAITGLELDKMSQAKFEKEVERISVYARVNPEHKIRIVQALKKHGHQVAMTGDGVNDAPAIKAADIGIAMGITGTDATKEASDLILLDDQFLTIIAAIEEGRGIFDNVRKFVNYLLSANIAEVITILLGVVLFQNLVLTAAQLLFINIVTDGLPAVALGSDPAEKGIMRFKPHHFQGHILNKRVWVEMIVFGLLMSIALLLQYNWDIHGGSTAVAAAFTAMVVYEMVRLVDIRTDYHIPWFSNPWLSVAIAGSLALQLAVLYVPPLARLFGVGPISGQNWLIIAVGSVGLFIIMKVLNPLLDRWMPEIRST
jgi:Ca2+-transporting ATPase